MPSANVFEAEQTDSTSSQTLWERQSQCDRTGAASPKPDPGNPLTGEVGNSSAKVYLGESDTSTNPCSGAQKSESIYQAGPTSLAGTCYQKMTS